jgi:hypothetical protein
MSVIRTVIKISDGSVSSLIAETYTDINDEESRSRFAVLKSQADIALVFCDDRTEVHSRRASPTGLQKQYPNYWRAPNGCLKTYPHKTTTSRRQWNI